MTKKLNFKFLFFLTLAFISLSSTIYAANPVNVSYGTSITIKRPLQEIFKIALDVENTCERGCRYKVSNVATTKRIENINKNSFYVWEQIKSGVALVSSTKTFRYVYYSLAANGKSGKIESTYPSSSEISRLARHYNLKHDTFFDNFNMVINFNVIGHEGNKEIVKVDYHISITSHSSMISSFSSKVKHGMEKTAKEIFYNYQKASL